MYRYVLEGDGGARPQAQSKVESSDGGPVVRGRVR